eukprot:9467042-Alexandrium_andersonii.AAC.1
MSRGAQHSPEPARGADTPKGLRHCLDLSPLGRESRPPRRAGQVRQVQWPCGTLPCLGHSNLVSTSTTPPR